MSNRKEEQILKYLEKTYGNRETFDTEKSFGVNGVCIYFKNIKKLGFTGVAHLDLVSWFGDGNYHLVMKKWFSEKYNLEVI